MKFPEIISVTPIKKYKLFVRFSDASEGEYDISHLAGKGVFKSFTAIAAFAIAIFYK